MAAEDAMELICIHIPKTAGTSFRRTLEAEYGKRNVWRIDIVGRRGGNVRVNKQPRVSREIPPHVKVVVGHFPYRRLLEHFDVDTGLPVVTWLRRPEDRVISEYYYLQKRLQKNTNAKGRELLPRLTRSLAEYAQLPQFRNQMCRYLEGLELEDFLHIGLVEEFESDLSRLADLLGWTTRREFFVNRSHSAEKPVSAHDRQIVRAANGLDEALYQRVLRQRASVASPP